MCLDSVICALLVICLQMPALPKGEPRSRSEPHTCRIRLSLAQTCPRAAPSVTACAVPPSSERKAFSYAQTKLVSPSGRDVAQRQRGLGSLVRELDLPQAKTEGVLQIDKIRMRFALTRTCSHVCPLSHLLCKCQLSQRESREAGANRTPDEPS